MNGRDPRLRIQIYGKLRRGEGGGEWILERIRDICRGNNSMGGGSIPRVEQLENLKSHRHLLGFCSLRFPIALKRV